MSLQVRMQDLATAIATDIKLIRTFVTGSSTGDLTGLTTTSKTSLITAINEVNGKAAPTPPAASTTTPGIVALATLAEAAAGVDAAKAMTAAAVRQERIALKAEILGATVPGALDTLDELANALGDDANFASTITTGLSNRVRHDVANQGLTTAQQGNARTNIAAVGQTQIGNEETDLVAVYAAAKV